MPTYTYRARNGTGRELRGHLGAPDEGKAVEHLRRQGLLVLEVVGEAVVDRRTAARPRGLRGPRGRDVEMALRQVALMRRSGLSLLTALRSASAVAGRASMREVLNAVAAEVEAGESFAESLARHRCFSQLVIALVRAGETSGSLEPALERGADHLERRRRLRGTILHALFYPAIVVTATVAVTAYLVFEVIPELEQFLLGFDRRLPPMTQLLLGLTHWLDEQLPLLAILLGGGALAVLAIDRWLPGRRAIDAALYRVPGLGMVRRAAATALFARALSVLLRSGINLLAALGLARGLLSRPIAREDVDQLVRDVSSGRPLAEAVRTTRSFSPLLPSMVQVGESTGNLDHVLEELARHEESRLAEWIARATTLVEPVLTIAVGSIVGFVYIAFFTSLFAIAGGRS